MSFLRLMGRERCRAVNGPGPGSHALPGDRPTWGEDRPAEGVHLRLELALDAAEGRVAGTATHHLRPFNDGTASITLDAVEMDIEAVAVDGVPAEFEYDGARLFVRLDPPAERGVERRVAVTYGARPRAGLYFVGPDEAYPDKPFQVWSQGQDDDSRHWFPCFDQPNGRQTTEMLVTVPGDWIAVSNGRLLEDKRLKDGRRRLHWHQDRPHPTYLVALVAGDFARVESAPGSPPVDFYVEPAATGAVERTFGQTGEMIAAFERITGVAFPWSRYSQAVVRDFVFGGMENTTLTILYDGILLDERAAVDHTSDGLISHELAHQWFGDLLTCREWSHGWLNEGFATYFELLWEEEVRGVDAYRSALMEIVERYMDERYRRPLVSNVYRAPIDLFDRHLYEKGALVLHMLRHVLGDDAFFRSIRRYAAENADRAVLTHDLADAVEAETGRNLGWFFDQWVFRAGHPRLRVRWAWNDETRVASVTVEQTQDTAGGVPEAFRFPVTVEFRGARGRPRRFRVEVQERRHVFAFALASRPEVCAFDPGAEVLKEIEFDKAPRELVLQLRHDGDIVGRAFAAVELGKVGGAEAVGALEASARHDRAWRVQAEAGRALGALRTPAARDALLRAVSVRDARARRGVVEGLGEFRGDTRVHEVLVPVALRDPSWFVRAEALRSIGRLRVPAAFDLLVGAMGGRSFREVVRIGAIDGLVSLRDERAIDVIDGAADWGAPAPARRWAVVALGKLADEFPGRVREIGDRIVPRLRDPDFRVRVAAAAALRAVGDRRHAGELEAMARREVDGRAVRAAREAAFALRAPEGSREAISALRGDLEELREENARLHEQLTALEARLQSS